MRNLVGKVRLWAGVVDVVSPRLAWASLEDNGIVLTVPIPLPYRTAWSWSTARSCPFCARRGERPRGAPPSCARRGEHTRGAALPSCARRGECTLRDTVIESRRCHDHRLINARPLPGICSSGARRGQRPMFRVMGMGQRLLLLLACTVVVVLHRGALCVPYFITRDIHGSMLKH